MCLTFCLDSYVMQTKVVETVCLSRICDILNLNNANSWGTQLRQNHPIVIARRKLRSRELARINAWGLLMHLLCVCVCVYVREGVDFIICVIQLRSYTAYYTMGP